MDSPQATLIDKQFVVQSIGKKSNKKKGGFKNLKEGRALARVGCWKAILFVFLLGEKKKKESCFLNRG